MWDEEVHFTGTRAGGFVLTRKKAAGHWRDSDVFLGPHEQGIGSIGGI
jgi:hypothetical protein